MEDKGTPVSADQTTESDKERLYGELLLNEARLLLGKYLPIALPQEPTEVLSGFPPFYMGKFKGKHYIQREPVALMNAQFDGILEKQRQSIEATTQAFEQAMKQQLAWVELLAEKFESGEWTEDTNLDELEREFFTLTQPPPQPPKPEFRLEREENPENLSKGYSQYSLENWIEVYSLVHELIHQRQAELNPKAFPKLASPELDNLNPENTPRKDLRNLLTQAHKSRVKTEVNNSLYYPVIEGMAVVGSFYIMGRLANDLSKSEQKDVAAKIEQARAQNIFQEVIQENRNRRKGQTIPYYLNYVEGFSIVRKLYRQYREQTPNLLATVDLGACKEIIKCSPAYQQIIKNPTLLPGIQEEIGLKLLKL